VDLSIWSAELAWQPKPESSTLSGSSSKKRKRGDELFPAEIWRARNVPNDNLGLRQPVRITSLTYLSPSSSGHHIISGTQFGDLRRYDTRAARRPVSDWKAVGKVGGVRLVEKGLSEHELFVSDNGSNLYSIDLRTGGILHGYKGISGAVTSISPSSTTQMVSTSLDRYFRVHTVVPPPSLSASNLERRGEIVEKTYLTSVPTVIVWDQLEAIERTIDDNTSEHDDLWDQMEHVD
jgi:ribosome biogenesis protein NSA1